MLSQIKHHHSCRNFTTRQIEPSVMTEILSAAIRASNTGNMQLYSIIATSSPEIKRQLEPLHFNQPAATSAPVLLTFCADINRFSKWCRLRDAAPGYDNFLWFESASVDAVLASSNACIEAEAHGLGICYLGTTLYNAGRIASVLKLPRGVIPVMTVAVGYPAVEGELTDRLPLDAVVHQDTYHDYTDKDIERIWQQREASPETAALLKENGLPNLAQIFTLRRYTADDSVTFSRAYLDEVKKQGFFNQ